MESGMSALGFRIIITEVDCLQNVDCVHEIINNSQTMCIVLLVVLLSLFLVCCSI